jgi:hypothetical protein
MGTAVCRHARGSGRRGRALALSLLLLVAGRSTGDAQLPLGLQRFDQGRFTVGAAPHDAVLARSILGAAVARDTFPWLPRPSARVLILIAPDRRRFAELIGPHAPEYGAAIAVPAEQRIVMQGSRAGSDAGDPLQVLRHELAHLALHEAMGDLPPRWFDEGYASLAAGEWGREEVLMTNVALAWRGVPSLEALEAAFYGGAARASGAYALAHRAVVELAALDPQRGLGLFFRYWRDSRDLDAAIREAYNMTQGQFEERWRKLTRRRYGALAIFADLTIGAIILLAVLVPLHLARRRRDRERLVRMAAVEAAAEAKERSDAIETLLKSVSPQEDSSDGRRGLTES